MTERRPGETFDAFKDRRTSEREALDTHLLGTTLVRGNVPNRKDIREFTFRRKGFGSCDPILYKRAKERRRLKRLKNQ